jgi:hypothetical protein
MEKTRTILKEILPMLGVFRVEKKRWPLHAAELQAFAFGLRKPLDLSQFHRLSFKPLTPGQLSVDFTAIPDESLWAGRGQAEIHFSLSDPLDGDTLPLKVRMVSLPAQQVEVRSYCAI